MSELRISRSISGSPLEFEITRVDCICICQITVFSYFLVKDGKTYFLEIFLDLFPESRLQKMPEHYERMFYAAC